MYIMNTLGRIYIFNTMIIKITYDPTFYLSLTLDIVLNNPPTTEKYDFRT